jgi:7,8-dihydropterin-6-yl-methyl-4-(beta-D-ribofuranosyl)aminobenzene 5'-phosphate synthase
MDKNLGFGNLDSVSITILVDNYANLIVESSDSIKYFKDKPLLAEHGFSALIHIPDSGINILWDAGISNIALMENISRLGINPKTIQKIALSHGHGDHYSAITDFLRSMELESEPKEWDEPFTSRDILNWKSEKYVPLIVHPAAFRERWWTKDDGTKVGPLPIPPRIEWESLGAKIVLSSEPYSLVSGCWTTGYVPRRSFEKSGRPTNLLYRDGDDFFHDDLDEDQAIVINIKQKGLVVLSGCAHAGIINTIKRAREISGIDQVYAVLGGFHLARSNEKEIQQTISVFKELNPKILIPCHCTGFQAMCAIAQHLPDQFHHGVVGATYMF